MIKKNFNEFEICLLNLYGDFSGFEATYDAMEKGLAGLEEVLAPNGRFVRSPLKYCRSSDKGILQLRVLKGRTQHHDACLFGNLFERVPDLERRFIEASIGDPDDNDVPEIKRLIKHRANEEIDNFIKSNREKLFPRDAVAPCRTHNRLCPVIPRRENSTSASSSGAHAASSSGSRGTKRNCNDECCDDESYDDGFNENACDDEKLERKHRTHPLNISTSGVPCLPYSSAGGRQGAAHQSHPVDTAWRQERVAVGRRAEEDLAFIECVPSYPIEGMKADMPGHEVVHVIDGPEFHGQPAKRRRLLGAAINRETLVWCGPIDYQLDYENRFHRAHSCNGDVLFCGSQSEIEQEYCELARVQRISATPEQIRNMTATLKHRKIKRGRFGSFRIDKNEKYYPSISI